MVWLFTPRREHQLSIERESLEGAVSYATDAIGVLEVARRDDKCLARAAVGPFAKEDLREDICILRVATD